MSGAKAVAFLAKKSWHTGTLHHMEKVWKAEERSKQEQKKTDELKRELAEEKQVDELRRAHEKTTGIKRPDTVDFLYQQPMGMSEVTADDYLLGKRYTEKGEDNDVKKVVSQPGSLFMNAEQDAMQDKRYKIREDPLFAIKKEERKSKERLKDNPIQMKKLREEILRKKLREERKERKEERRKKRKSRHGRDDEEEHGKKKRKTSTDKQVWVEKPTSDSKTPASDSHRSDRRESRDNDRGTDRSRDDDRRADRSDNDRRDSRRDDRRRDYRRDDDRRRNQDKPASPPKSRRPDDRSSQEKPKPSSSRSSRKMTAEEKQKLLEQMQADAKVHENERLDRIKRAAEEDARETKTVKIKTETFAPEFISTMGKDVYTDSSTASIEDRIKRNRFYIQKTNLDEKGMFKD